MGSEDAIFEVTSRGVYLNALLLRSLVASMPPSENMQNLQTLAGLHY